MDQEGILKAAQRLIDDGQAGAVPVLFYHQDDHYGWASNFSKHPVTLPNPFTGELTLYKTGEHRFQAMKATTRADHNLICAKREPMDAKQLGRHIKLRPGWGENYGDLCWYVMFETVLAKVRQHPDIELALSLTEDRPIYEDSPYDDIWGWKKGNSYHGKNLLGRCWMEVRDVIKSRSDF